MLHVIIRFRFLEWSGADNSVHAIFYSRCDSLQTMPSMSYHKTKEISFDIKNIKLEQHYLISALVILYNIL